MELLAALHPSYGVLGEVLRAKPLSAHIVPAMAKTFVPAPPKPKKKYPPGTPKVPFTPAPPPASRMNALEAKLRKDSANAERAEAEAKKAALDLKERQGDLVTLQDATALVSEAHVEWAKECDRLPQDFLAKLSFLQLPRDTTERLRDMLEKAIKEMRERIAQS